MRNAAPPLIDVSLLLVNCQPGANVFTLTALHRRLRCAALKMLDHDWALAADFVDDAGNVTTMDGEAYL